MAIDKYDVLAALPKSSLKGGGHLNCKECGFQSCVVFAMKVANGKTQLSECPHISDGTIKQLNCGVNQSAPILVNTTESHDGEQDILSQANFSTTTVSNNQATSNKNKKQKQSGIIEDAVAVLSIPNDNLFITNKNELKEFSTQIPEQTNLPTVPTEGGLFGLFNHNVTGEELNNLTENIQGRMIEQNKAVVKIIQEFNKIYDTFSYLDKIYVQEILITLNAAVKANEKANASLEKLTVQQNKIKYNQQDIKQVINQQKQIIQVLKNFKERLEKLKHLTDVDKIYNSCLNIQTKIDTLEKATDEQKVKSEQFSNEQTKFANSLKCINNFNIVLSQNIQELDETLCEQKKLTSELEKAVEQGKKDNIGTAQIIEGINNRQANLEKSLDDQRGGIERFSETQKEFAILLANVGKANDELNQKLAKSIEETKQHFSEIKRDTEQCNDGYIEKYNLLEVAVEKCEQATHDFYSKMNSEIEQASNKVDKKCEAVQNELIVLRKENATLSKSLIIVKGISAASMLLSFVIFILFLTGALR